MTPRAFCPGYDRPPFDGLAATYPGADVYPAADFRLERGPTWPESSSRSGGTTLAAATAALLANWNAALPALRAAVTPDDPGAANAPLYGDAWQPGDLVEIPAGDLPAGTPPWWRSLEAWADRTGPDAETKRATVTVTVPTAARPWH